MLISIKVFFRELRQEIRTNARYELESLLGFFDDQDFSDETEIKRLETDLEKAKENLSKAMLDLPGELFSDFIRHLPVNSFRQFNNFHTYLLDRMKCHASFATTEGCHLLLHIVTPPPLPSPYHPSFCVSFLFCT